MREPSDDIAVLQQHLGPQWPGTEADGHAAMVKVLQTVRGYDHAQTEAVIAALISAGKLCYHHLGYAQVEAMAARTVPQAASANNLATWLLERHRHNQAITHAGYWEIGNRHENALGRAGQINPMG
jgi:hypothetical protein